MLRNLTLITFVFIGLFANAQDLILKGKVVDKQTRTPIEGANVYVEHIEKGTATNSDGAFKIALPKAGSYRFYISFIGYKSIDKNLQISSHGKTLFFELSKKINELEDVQVIAKKRNVSSVSKINLPAKDIPITISTLGKETLEEMQITTINDAMRYATGVKPLSMYGGFQTFKFRGLGRPVIMVDGAVDYRMVFSNSAPVTSLTAVERIEYLKGPASVTHGHSADGGVLNIVRKQPTEKPKLNFSAQYGSWKNKGISLGAGGKISDKLNYRFDAGLSDKEGWRDYAQKYANVYGALDYKINNKNKLEFRLGANEDFYATETGFPVMETTIYNAKDKKIYQKGDWVKEFNRKQRYNDPQDFLKNKNRNGGINFIRSFTQTSKLNFRNSYTYDYIDYFSTEALSFPTSDKADFAFYFLDKEGQKKYIDIKNIKRSYPYRFAHQTKTFQSSLDFSTVLETGNIKHNLLIGYNLILLDRTTFRANTKKDISGSGKYATISVTNPILNQGNLSEKFSNARIYGETVNSLYIQDLVDFSKKLKALIALRVDHYNMDYQTATIETHKDFKSKTEKTYQKETPLTYRVGLVYEPIKELSLYGSYSNYFRPNRRAYPTNAIYINKNGNIFNPDFFNSEKGYQIEAGVKLALNNKVELNGSIYFIQKENIVEYIGKTPEENPIYAQIGQAESKGFEIDLTYRPIDKLSISAGYTLCDAKYTEFNIKKYKSKNKGNYLSRNPKNQFFLWSFYEIPKSIFKGMNFGLGINYNDKMYTTASNEYELPSYWLTEAAIGYKINNLYCKLKVNNLFNEKYISNSVSSNQFIPGEERNFLFTIGYKL